jgi:uncharacterized protein
MRMPGFNSKSAPVRLKLRILDGSFAVVRLGPGKQVPPWAGTGNFISITRSADELSIVCPQANIPARVLAEKDWRCLKVEGPLDFSAVGIMACLSGALANANISLLAVSTYNTDFLLVKSKVLPRAITALKDVGCRLTQKGHRKKGQ